MAAPCPCVSGFPAADPPPPPSSPRTARGNAGSTKPARARRRRTLMVLVLHSSEAHLARETQPPAAAHDDIILDIMPAMVSMVRSAFAGSPHCATLVPPQSQPAAEAVLEAPATACGSKFNAVSSTLRAGTCLTLSASWMAA